MVLSIRVGKVHNVRVYSGKRSSGSETQVVYRAAYHQKGWNGKRNWSGWSTSVKSTIAGVLRKVQVKNETTDAVWAEILKHRAAGYKPQVATPPSHNTEVVFFRQRPFEGRILSYFRSVDDKVRMRLRRPGYKRVDSNWHCTRHEAFECIKARCNSMGLDEPALSRAEHFRKNVQFIHQIYGLFKDGKDMSSLFTLSSSAWQAYAARHHCEYKLWNADEIDTLILTKAIPWLQDLYRDVRYDVQRVDVARFFILWMYGGLYADLGTFPNIERFPLVPLGLCSMLASTTKTMCKGPEWEMDVVVATAGNPVLIDILKNMSTAMAENRKKRHYDEKVCSFVCNTTGAVQLGELLQSSAYAPHVTVFSMVRPVGHLERYLSMSYETGKFCHLLGDYDVISPFSMSDKAGMGRAPPALGQPLAQLPPFPKMKKGLRYTRKTTEPLAASVDKQTTSGCEQQPQTQPGSQIVNQMQPGYEPQQTSNHSGEQQQLLPIADKVQPGSEPKQISPQSENMTQEERDVFDDMVDMFLNQRDKFVDVGVAYTLLEKKTRTYLQGIRSTYAADLGAVIRT